MTEMSKCVLDFWRLKHLSQLDLQDKWDMSDKPSRLEVPAASSAPRA